MQNVNILVVDDLVDSGSTLKLIRAFFHGTGINVKFAALYQNTVPNNLEIIQRADYYGEDKPDGWLDFPWDTLTN